MKRQKRGLACLLVMALLLGMLPTIPVQADVVTGTVNASDGLNVRTGAGINFPNVQSDGVNVKLPMGTNLTILSESNGWYQVSFEYLGKALEGFVSGVYVTKSTGATTSSPTASTEPTVSAAPPTTGTPSEETRTTTKGDTKTTVTTKRTATEITTTTTTAKTLLLNIRAKLFNKQYVRKKAKETGAILKIKKKKVQLSKGKAVKILKEKTVKGKRWYCVSFKKGSKTYKGYISAVAVSIKGKSNLFSGVITSTKKIKVRKAAGTKGAYLKTGKSYIKLKSGKKIKIISEKTIKGVKWFRIRFLNGGKRKKGYIPAQYVNFVRGIKKSVKTDTTPLVELSDGDFEAVMSAQGFPEDYKPALRELHKKYPYWQFQAFHTGIEWNTAISYESKLGMALLPNMKADAWKSFETGAYNYSTNSHVIFDGSYWVCASKAAVEYYMDPRNFLNESSVFQFEALEYQPAYQTRDGVANILKNTALYSGSYTYTDDAGSSQTKTYIDTFMEAAQTVGVSPYYLASRCRQEVVTGTTTLSNSVTGKLPGYEGLYNFFNIGSNDSKEGLAVQNGLEFAKKDTTYMRPWTNPYRSIMGGTKYIGEKYILRKAPQSAEIVPPTQGQVNLGQQNTMYLQKFNVTPYQPYTHQYMTNIEAANAEAQKVYSAYKGNIDQTPIVFTIPVFVNMPAQACPVPSGEVNPNNYLKRMTISQQLLTSDSEILNAANRSDPFTVTLSAGIGTLSIMAQAVNSKATVQAVVNGVAYPIAQKDKYQSEAITLNVGQNDVKIIVTAANGAQRTYQALVTRQ